MGAGGLAVECSIFYMARRLDTIAARALRAASVSVVAVALSIVMTWPLASGFGRLGRTTTMDGLYSIWNISWVAHALVSDPAHLLDANIFSPHRRALTFSEANLLGGVVATPVWWLTGNAYAAHNTALIFAFCSALVGTWLLVRRLTGSSAAAAPAAILFAFCPYLFSHSAHIQLLMAGGIPLAMLALPRLCDNPSPRRGVVLGLTLGGQALACAYYGIFAGLMVGYGALFLAASRRLWTVGRFWVALAIGAGTSIAVVFPFFLPYLTMQREEGFRRSLADAVRYSAPPASYLASPAHAHQWLIPIARRWGWRADEVLFPGLLALTLGAAGLAVAIRTRRPLSGPAVADREAALLYASMGLVSAWASLGPPAGLYTAMFHSIPLFTFLRAPSRFGLIVAF